MLELKFHLYLNSFICSRDVDLPGGANVICPSLIAHEMRKHLKVRAHSGSGQRGSGQQTSLKDASEPFGFL